MVVECSSSIVYGGLEIESINLWLRSAINHTYFVNTHQRKESLELFALFYFLLCVVPFLISGGLVISKCFLYTIKPMICVMSGANTQ